MPDLPFDDEKQSLLHQFKEFLRKVYPNESNNKQTTNTTTMKKTFTFIAAVLALAAFECEEGGKVEMTCDQLKDIDDRLKHLTDQAEADKTTITQHTATIDDLKAQLEAKNAELQAMAKKPAEETKQVTNQGQGSKETSPLQNYCDEVKEAQQMLNQLNK
jgi:hypothetical protein